VNKVGPMSIGLVRARGSTHASFVVPKTANVNRILSLEEAAPEPVPARMPNSVLVKRGRILTDPIQGASGIFSRSRSRRSVVIVVVVGPKNLWDQRLPAHGRKKRSQSKQKDTTPLTTRSDRGGENGRGNMTRKSKKSMMKEKLRGHHWTLVWHCLAYSKSKP
jgi:hypothetical protein